jgi:hypothetical protein
MAQDARIHSPLSGELRSNLADAFFEVSRFFVCFLVPAYALAWAGAVLHGRISTGVWSGYAGYHSPPWHLAGDVTGSTMSVVLVVLLPVPAFAALTGLVSFVLKPSRGAAALLLIGIAACCALLLLSTHGWLLG